ncbi:hypothetical protein GCM10017687_62790 [Streptomyces echinatus]
MIGAETAPERQWEEAAMTGSGRSLPTGLHKGLPGVPGLSCLSGLSGLSGIPGTDGERRYER